MDYQEKTTVELLWILKTKEEYTTEAIYAAQKVLSTRIVSEKDNAEIEKRWIIRQTEKADETRKSVEWGYVRQWFKDTISPLYENRTVKILNYVVLAIFGLYLYNILPSLEAQWYNVNAPDEWGNLVWMFRLAFLFDFVFLPILLITLLLRKQWAWCSWIFLLFLNQTFCMVHLVLQNDILGLKVQAVEVTLNYIAILRFIIGGLLLWYFVSQNVYMQFGFFQVLKKVYSILTGAVLYTIIHMYVIELLIANANK